MNFLKQVFKYFSAQDNSKILIKIIFGMINKLVNVITKIYIDIIDMPIRLKTTS